MHHRQAFIATSERVIDATGHGTPVVAGMFHDPRTILRLVDERCLSHQREATVIVGHDFHGERALDLPAGDGWTCITSTTVDRTPTGFPVWSTWTRGGRTHDPDTADRVVHIGVLPHIDADRTPLFWPEEDPRTIAGRLGVYHALTGSAWRGTAGVVGCAMLRDRYNIKPQPRWFGEKVPAGAGDLLWSREGTPGELLLGHVHAFDLNAQYLSAAGNAVLPWTGLKPSGPHPFDARTSGMWRVEAGSLPRWALYGAAVGLPPMLSHIHMSDEQLWISAPMMVLLHQLGARPRVTDSMLATESKRLLRSWAETLRNAREDAEDRRDARLLGAIKRTCNETIGMWARAGGRMYRPDWRVMVVDLARANLYRRIRHVHERAARWPLAVRTDCVWYADDDPDPVRAAERLGLRIGRGLGEWKVVDSMPAHQYTPDVIKPQREVRRAVG